VHTDASKDGFGTVEDLVNDAVDKGFKSLAMTDHGTLANAITFWSLCKEKGIKPILGMEGYIRYDRSVKDRNHLTLLAKTEEGFQNLIALDNHAHDVGWDGRFPVFGLDDLNRWSKGLHVLTGCNASPLHDSEYEDGMQFVGHLVDIMGRDNLHAEVMFISSYDDYKRSLEASIRFEIPFVVTNDTHFCGKGKHEHQQTIYKARVGTSSVGYTSDDCYLKTAHEMVATGERWVHPEQVHNGLAQSLLIAEEVEEWNMFAEPSLPKVKDAEESLVRRWKLAYVNDVKGRSVAETKERYSRLKREVQAFRERNLVDYVYILDDIIGHARDEGILVGPGRGSGGGSYALYLLGITSVDPLHYGLLFERFLSDARADYPDVDVDFESARRGEVIAYAAEKWGAIPIATYNRYSHKSAVRDLGKWLKVPTEIITQAAEHEEGAEPFWLDFCEAAEPRIAQETYDLMLGQIRHVGRHAGGVVITDKPIPMERLKDGLIAAAWSEGLGTRELSKAGIVKYDLLGLTALSQLQSMVDQTGVDLPASFDSKEVLDAFGQGEMAGIFQWSGSEGIRKMTMELWEAGGDDLTFNDLIAVNALFRPGALDAGTAMKYKGFKKSPREIHPTVDSILAETYGVICYQEQVMAVYAEVSGKGLGEANELRRAFAHGKEGDRGRAEHIATFEKSFMEGGKANGYETPLLAEIWREIQTHSRYSFNKSHSTAYSMIAYWMMYYRVHHFSQFIKAMMLFDMTNAQTYLVEAAKRGIEIKAPHVNISTDKIELSGDKKSLYLPLSDVKFWGDKNIQVFLNIRRELEKSKGEGNAFDTYEAFNDLIPKRVCNKRVRQNLERIGGFLDLLGDATDAIDDYESIPFTGKQDAHREVLGYLIPDAELLAEVESWRKKPLPKSKRYKGCKRYAGVVSQVKKQKIRSGKTMYVITISPYASLRSFGDARDDIPKEGYFVTGAEHNGIIRGPILRVEKRI
jgi:DNA polymerase-3 subunit alpha